MFDLNCQSALDGTSEGSDLNGKNFIVLFLQNVTF